MQIVNEIDTQQANACHAHLRTFTRKSSFIDRLIKSTRGFTKPVEAELDFHIDYEGQQYSYAKTDNTHISAQAEILWQKAIDTTKNMLRLAQEKEQKLGGVKLSSGKDVLKETDAYTMDAAFCRRKCKLQDRRCLETLSEEARQ